MRFRRLFEKITGQPQTIVGATASTILDPLNGVVEGDDIRQDAAGRLIAPMVGYPGFRPVEVMLVVGPKEKYNGQESVESIHQIVTSFSDPDLISSSTTSRPGSFKLETPPLNPGEYHVWVLVYAP